MHALKELEVLDDQPEVLTLNGDDEPKGPPPGNQPKGPPPGNQPKGPPPGNQPKGPPPKNQP